MNTNNTCLTSRFSLQPNFNFQWVVSLNRLGLLILISFLASCEVQLCGIVVVMVSASLFTTLAFYFCKVYANSKQQTAYHWFMGFVPWVQFYVFMWTHLGILNCKKGTNHTLETQGGLTCTIVHTNYFLTVLIRTSQLPWSSHILLLQRHTLCLLQHYGSSLLVGSHSKQSK